MELPENIIMVKGAESSSNAYLVIGKTNAIIDPGLPENYANAEKEIARHGGAGIVLCTHGHYDHFGAGVLLRKNHGCKIGVHDADAREMEASSSLQTCEQYFEREHESVPVDFRLKSGQAIEGTELEAIHTPGHSPGSVCFFLRLQKILFTGDLIFAGGYVGRTDLVGSDHDMLVDSIKRIAELDVEMILPGHGKPVMAGARAYIKDVLETLDNF